MRVFITGATGYIGGSVAARLVEHGHQVSGLVRTEPRAALVREKGIVPVVGTLDDAQVLAGAANTADVVINAASADHLGAVQAMLAAMRGSEKLFVHTSGSSIVGTRAEGKSTADVFDERATINPSPARAARVALNQTVLDAAGNGIRPVVICPSLIYGAGHGVHENSMQVPWLITLARSVGAARHIGPGENIWSNVHIDDLVDLYVLALDKAPAGAFYFAENGEHSMREVCQAVSRMLGFGGGVESMTVAQGAQVWGEGPANDTMASNSRVRATRAREELGWRPSRPSLIEEIERGCYAQGRGV